MWRSRGFQRGERCFNCACSLRKRKSQVHEDEERVETIHQGDEGLTQLTDGDLAHQQQNGHSQHGPV